MPHTSSKQNRGQAVPPRETIYDEELDEFVAATRTRKHVGRNSRYFEDIQGWKSSYAPRQWARHKRGVGPIVARRTGNGHSVTMDDDWYWLMNQHLYQFDEEPFGGEAS